MNRERKKGLTYSSAFHLLLLLTIIFGLPYLLPPDDLTEPMAISVEVLPVAAISNVRPSNTDPSPEKKAEEKKPEPPKPPKPEEKKEEKKPAPPVKTKEPEPAPEPKPEEKPDPKKEEKKPEEKKEEKKKPEEKKPAKEDPLDAILKSVKQTDSEENATDSDPKPEKATASSSTSKSRSNKFDPNSPEALSLRDSISNQVYKCWNVQAGVKNAHEIVVLVEVEYDKSGTPLRVELSAKSAAKAATDAAYRAAADAARRAVRQCAPLQGMPPESFHIWQYTDINFDPKDMLF